MHSNTKPYEPHFRGHHCAGMVAKRNREVAPLSVNQQVQFLCDVYGINWVLWMIVQAQLCNPTAKGSSKVPGLFRFFGAWLRVTSPRPQRLKPNRFAVGSNLGYTPATYSPFTSLLDGSKLQEPKICRRKMIQH